MLRCATIPILLIQVVVILSLGVGSPTVVRKAVGSQEAMIVLIRRQTTFRMIVDVVTVCIAHQPCWNTAIVAVNPRLHKLISSDFWTSSDSIGSLRTTDCGLRTTDYGSRTPGSSEFLVSLGKSYIDYI
jgi:hypothetical protein